MVREQLIINGTEVELLDSIQANFTYSIADISQPDKRKADFSKTIKVPGSKTVNKLFNHIFEINIDSTFNPNLKLDAVYLIDSEEIFDGYVQLKQINKLDNDDITYNIVLFGRLANLFNEVGELELTDIQGLDEFDHDYTNGNQQLSWATSVVQNGSPQPFALGFGYVYPMINYGFDNDLTGYDVTELFPAFYVKEYWDRIFADAGFTYQSTFLSTSARFKRLIIPYNSGDLALTDAQIANRLFEANTPNYVAGGTSITTPKNNPQNADLRFTNEVNDPSGQHDPATGIWTVGQTGYYNINTFVDLTATFTPTGAPSDVTSNCYFQGAVRIIKDDGVTETILDGSVVYIYHEGNIPNTGLTTSASPTYPSTEYVIPPVTTTGNTSRVYNPANRYFLQATNVFLESGDEVFVRLNGQNKRIDSTAGGGTNNYFESVASPGTYYDGDIDLNLLSTGKFLNQVVNVNLLEGNTIDMYQVVPKGIKQKDFLLKYIKKYNLYIEPDKDNPRNLIIEPRDQFYLDGAANVEDWSEILDVSQDLEILPMGALDVGRYIFRDKQDKDYYNEIYEGSWDKVYGEREIVINNDFLSNEKEIKTEFSPTPLVGQATQDRVVSTIIKVDDNQAAKRTESNIRCLIYGGLKNTVQGWLHGQTTRFEYPYAGHLDDPFNPTFDFNWGMPREIYYDDTFQAINFTDANAYNEYWSKSINEITDPNSKIARGWFYLTPSRIRNLSFRKLYYFDDAYFRLNKVENYNPKDVAITKCEFLKIKEAALFTPTAEGITGGKGEKIGDEDKPINNNATNTKSNGNSFDEKSVNVQGNNNYVNRTAKNINVQGDDNKVFSDTDTIYIKGNGNTILEGVENVSLINTNNVEVSESKVTYVNGVLVGGSGSVVEKSANFDATAEVLTYLVDTSGANISCGLDPAVWVEGMVKNFKKMDAANVMQLKPLSGSTIDEKTTVDVERLYTNAQVQFDGTNFIII